MAPDAMTIPERLDDDGVARAAQSGPVFSVDPLSGKLHMRYTARTRSVLWKDNAITRDAVAFWNNCWEATTPTFSGCAWHPAWAWCATTCCMTAQVSRTTLCNPGCFTGPDTLTELRSLPKSTFPVKVRKLMVNQPLVLYP
jgi:hypothetical protein